MVRAAVGMCQNTSYHIVHGAQQRSSDEGNIYEKDGSLQQRQHRASTQKQHLVESLLLGHVLVGQDLPPTLSLKPLGLSAGWAGNGDRSRQTYNFVTPRARFRV